MSSFTNYGAARSNIRLLVWNARPLVWSVLNHMSKFQNFLKYEAAPHNIQPHETWSQTFQTCSCMFEAQSHTRTCPNLLKYNFSYHLSIGIGISIFHIMYLMLLFHEEIIIFNIFPENRKDNNICWKEAQLLRKLKIFGWRKGTLIVIFPFIQNNVPKFFILDL